MRLQPKDHLLAATKAALNAVPVVGGSIASLIGDYVPQSTLVQVEKATHLLASRLDELESRLDIDQVDKEQFSELFKTCYLTLVRSHNEQRSRAIIELLANLLLASSDPSKLPYAELDHFARVLEHLSSGALRVFATSLRTVLGRIHTPIEEDSEPLPIAFEEIHGASPDMSAELLMGLLSELQAAELVVKFSDPALRKAGYYNHSLGITMLGLRFQRYVLGAA
ncbi:MAG: hypothetical protein IPP44_00305 [Ideonella sp.]|nr:hypothetical protein [Ideonella sp.]